MNKIKFLFAIFVLAILFLTGCKVDTSFYLVDFTQINENSYEYKKDYTNDTEAVILDDIIKINDQKAQIKYYLDEGKTQEYDNFDLLLQEGDNYLYCTIYFSNQTSVDLTINFYRLKLFKVSFNTNCKIKIEDEYVEENSCVKKPNVKLQKAGYTFKSWNYNFNTPVTSDIIIEAQWDTESYVITYNPNGGILDAEYTIVTYNEPYNLEVPVKEGYTFMGWSYNGKIIDSEKWMYTEEITLVAQWEVETITYEIDYIIVGATGTNLQRTYTNKEEVVLRTPYKVGYKFVGWYFKGDFSGDRVYVLPKGTEGNLILYSKWEKFSLENANISFLGDSISTFYSSTSTVNSLYNDTDQYYYPTYSSTVKKVEQTWWYKVIEYTKTNLLVNDSWSGTACYNNGNEDNSAAMNYKRIRNLQNSDIVIVFIGTNDNVNGVSNEKFVNAYDTMIKRIKEVCGDGFIFCCTLGYSAYTGYNYTEDRRIDYNNIINTVAKNNDCEIIDLALVQTKDNYSQLLGDNLHPNQEGMIAYANKAIDTIRRFVGEIM